MIYEYKDTITYTDNAYPAHDTYTAINVSHIKGLSCYRYGHDPDDLKPWALMISVDSDTKIMLFATQEEALKEYRLIKFMMEKESAVKHT